MGCVTTDVNGAFEIDFKRCCGWWPWWWWEHRLWQLNPHLLDRLLAVLQRDPRFGKLPTPSPKPSLDIFQSLLDWSRGSGRDVMAELSPVRGGRAASGATLDAASLDGLRSRLLEVLPPAPEFERLKLWPWWPWYPWWDCDADIVFQVTQNCPGKESVIVDETIWDAHWDIPTDFNVTLHANDQACCVPNCMEDCPTGNCLLPTDLCYTDNVGSIGGNEGAIAAAPVGLRNPGLGSTLNYSADRPYAGTVPISGAFGDLTDVDYYEFLVYYAGKGTPGSPDPVVPPSPLPVPPIPASDYSPLPIPAFGGFDRQHLVFTPSPHWPSVPFHVQTISDGTTDHYVIESIAHYEKVNGVQLWDSGTFNLLALLNSGYLADGTYYLQVKTWTLDASGNLSNPQILPVCGTENNEPSTDNYWVVTINNQVVTSGPTDVNGLACGAPGSVHLCTGQPETAILQVQILHNDNTTTTIGPCDNVCIVDTDKLQVDFVAYDPDAYLAYYTLDVVYGSSQIVHLLDHGTPVPSTLSPLPFWVSAAAQAGPDYGQALSQGATSPWWEGGAIRLIVDPATVAFPETCAYTMQLYAHKRTISSCDYDFWNQYNLSELSFTIVNPCPQPAVGAAVGGLSVQTK